MTSGRHDPFIEIRSEVEAELARHFGAMNNRSHVGAAMRESVLAPAKRLRPVMTVIAARDLGCHAPAALRAGCAVELVHTASLLLDDLPCMDDATMRRGQPAIHLRYGQDVAILAAIALLSDAYGIAATLPDVPGERAARVVSALSDAIGLQGLVAGQYRDLHDLPPGGVDAAASINDQKTGSLFVTCLNMAATLAGLEAPADQSLHQFGREVGRAFQLFDDLLDKDGDAGQMGKDTGRDAGRPRLAAQLDRGEMMRLIGSHVAAARAALAGLPVRAKGLSALTDYLFGEEEAEDHASRAEVAALMPSFLAR